MGEPERLLQPILALQEKIRDAVVAACEREAPDHLAAVASDDAGDTVFVVDRVGEGALVAGLSAIAREEPLCLIAEGLPAEGLPLPEGTPASSCRWRVLVDPIDGTRGLMYQKRSAWVLTGVAPNRGPGTRLSDIVLAAQTEIPLVKQHLSDQLWAVRGRGMEARRFNRLTRESAGLTLRPSGAGTIAQGFTSVVRFFPGAREFLGAIDDEIALEVLGTGQEGKAGAFEDQYMSTGGQLQELIAGHDRFVADLRPLAAPEFAKKRIPLGLCCHPYDLAASLIAQEAGVILTGPHGEPLDALLDLTSDVAWIGYANAAVRAEVEPALRRALERRGLLASAPR